MRVGIRCIPFGESRLVEFRRDEDIAVLPGARFLVVAHLVAHHHCVATAVDDLAEPQGVEHAYKKDIAEMNVSQSLKDIFTVQSQNDVCRSADNFRQNVYATNPMKAQKYVICEVPHLAFYQMHLQKEDNEDENKYICPT